MSDRYDPKKLKRAWAAQIAAGAKPVDPRQREIERQAVFERHSVIRSLRDEPRADVSCKHDVSWLSCTICSKPRSRP